MALGTCVTEGFAQGPYTQKQYYKGRLDHVYSQYGTGPALLPKGHRSQIDNTRIVSKWTDIDRTEQKTVQ